MLEGVINANKQNMGKRFNAKLILAIISKQILSITWESMSNSLEAIAID